MQERIQLVYSVLASTAIWTAHNSIVLNAYIW